MIIVMQSGAQTGELSAVIARLEDLGYRVHLSQGEERSVIGIIGNGRPIEQDQMARMKGVEAVFRVTKPYKLASREFHPQDTVFNVKDVTIGGKGVIIIAGPCAVESRTQILEIAHAVKEAGAHILQGGAFKPRSSPYSFQGLGAIGLSYLAEAGEATGLPTITEVLEPDQVGVVAKHADILQIGARNAQNYALLNAVGRSQHPVMLNRGPSSTIEEWLLSAEYLLNHGNKRIFLCECGYRTSEKAYRNSFDINTIPFIKRNSHLPIIADSAEGAGSWELVTPVTLASIAAGADGVMIAVHPHPEEALSDGGKSLRPEKFAKMVTHLRAVTESVGRNLPYSA